ncbi:MAG TPA: VOC family protein [Candidatus Binataceae bacterium]|nr:VOC family protein [Candidatus Binataceae bacterium]
MASVTQLGYVGLNVSDIERWEQFATNILGFQSNGVAPDGSLSLRIDEYDRRFILTPGDADDLALLGWEVSNAEGLRALAAQLKAAGVEVRPGTSAEAEARRVVELIKFVEPSGIACEAFYGPLMSFERPFNSPRPITGFITGAMGLGHVLFLVDDYDRSVAFYRDALGMKISDYIQMKTGESSRTLAFFHCNRRHHTVAFAKGGNSGTKRLNHFMVQLKSVDDVGSTYYLCQERGVPLVRTLGRHSNDHMVSFYMRSPSGFGIEYGWGAREVDDNTWQVQLHHSTSTWGHLPATN